METDFKKAYKEVEARLEKVQAKLEPLQKKLNNNQHCMRVSRETFVRELNKENQLIAKRDILLRLQDDLREVLGMPPLKMRPYIKEYEDGEDNS